MDDVRIDKWLWAARFFKTRALAARACELGRVEMHGVTVKAARSVRRGDFVRVRTESGEYTVGVLELSEQRGPAVVARTLYAETPESMAERERQAEIRRLLPVMTYEGEGRPTKRDRRTMTRMRFPGA